MSGRQPIIELLNVSKVFPATRNGPEVVAFKNLSLSIEAKVLEEKESGDFVVLLGPSGCGKSTILSLIAGLTLPDGGDVLVFNEKVAGPHRYSATVPQAYTCFPWLSVEKNVEFGLRVQGRPKAERERIASDYLRKVGLATFSDANPGQLSGGMQQRVAIARTLAMKRPIVLMDEPFGALDAQTRAEMQQMLLDLWKKEKNTIVFVTHDITEALLLADRIVVFSPRPARIVHDMLPVPLPFERPPEIVHTAEFMESAEYLRNLLRKRSRVSETLGGCSEQSAATSRVESDDAIG
jgi:NitT/TauT family transport system ATP-binding protein